MLKRKEYLRFHEGDTSSDSGSSSSSDDDEGYHNSDSDEEVGTDGEVAGDEEEEEEEEERNERGSDGDARVDRRAAASDIEGMEWLGPMRCMLCGTLCLSRPTMLDHIKSKKHQRKLKDARILGGAAAVELEGMELAQGSYGPSRKFKKKMEPDMRSNDAFESVETHVERLERLRKAAGSGGTSAGNEDADERKAARRRAGRQRQQRRRDRKKRREQQNDSEQQQQQQQQQHPEGAEAGSSKKTTKKDADGHRKTATDRRRRATKIV